MERDLVGRGAALECSLRRALQRQMPEEHVFFLAERLCAEKSTAESFALYAQALAQYGRHRQAVDVVAKYWQQDLECRYWYALCCIEVNELAAAYKALSFLLQENANENLTKEVRSSLNNARGLPSERSLSVPWQAEGLYLLGRVFRLSNTRVDQAAQCLRRALEIDPFLWCCIEELSSLYRYIDYFVPEMFGISGKEEQVFQSGRSSLRLDNCILRWKTRSSGSPQDNFQALATVRALVEGYHCREAVALIATLPLALQQAPVVLKWQGRAYLDAGELSECARTFEKYLSLNRSGSLDGLEYYSTALWHMRRDVELNALARYALERDRFSAATWCIVGNAFSLQRDTDSAIEFFLRAAQIDPRNPYPCTLAGHEYLYLDNYDAAMRCYQDALYRNSRHYNAWFGIGQVYQRQEKFRLAEKHYRIALDLNSNNSMLWYYLGHVIRVGGGREVDALNALEKALEMNPRNPVARFECCKLYMQIGRLQDAWKELYQLRNMVPREAAIYYQMGVIARELGLKNAVELFSIALDLDPKQPLYRQALLSLDETQTAP